MTGPVAEWHHANLVPKTPTSGGERVTDETPSIIINRSWVCIGILREDALIPLFPEFLSLLRVTKFDSRNLDDEHPNIRSVADWSNELTFDGFERGQMMCRVFADYSGGAVSDLAPEMVLEDYFSSDESESQSEDSEDKKERLLQENTQWMLTDSVRMDLLQNKTGNAEDTIIRLLKFQKGEIIEEADRSERKDISDDDKTASYTLTLYDTWDTARITVWFAVPFGGNRVTTYLTSDIPEEFLGTLCGNGVSIDQVSSTTVPCRYSIPIKSYQEVAGRRRQMNFPIGGYSYHSHTGWVAADIASICYAHSLLMHVLTGPDPRRYDETYHWNETDSPMKETQIPSSLYEMSSSGMAGGLLLVSRSSLGADFVSGSAAFRFFFESLASRAAKVAHRQIMGLGVDPATGVYQQQRLVVAMVTRPWLATVLQVIADTTERTEKHEYLGCHVCAAPDRQAAWTVTGTGGIQVCSDACYAMLKEACK